MMHGSGCSFRCLAYNAFASALVQPDGGGTTGRKTSWPVACRFESDGPSWLITTRVEPRSAYVESMSLTKGSGT